MKRENRKNITTPRDYWFSAYDTITGRQFGYSCTAKNDEQAFRKLEKACGKNVDVADFGTWNDIMGW